MKLIGDDNQNGVFLADDSRNGFLPKAVFSVTINSNKIIEYCDIVYKSKTQLIIPLSPGTIREASKFKFIDGVQNLLWFDFDDIQICHWHQYWIYLKLLPQLLHFVYIVTQFQQDYCGQSTFLPLLLPLEPKSTKPGILFLFLGWWMMPTFGNLLNWTTMDHKWQYFMIIKNGCILNPSTQQFAINNRRIMRQFQNNCRFYINQVDVATCLFQQHVFSFVHLLCSILHYSLQVNFIMKQVFLWIIASCRQISIVPSLVCLIMKECGWVIPFTCFVLLHIIRMPMSLKNKFVGND